MSEPDKRTYVSRLREDQARATRRLIVAAAGKLYARDGFASTTIDAIAAEAGVSRKTVFSSVGGKVALLKLAYDHAMAGDDEPIAMIDREGLQVVIAEPDPYGQMRKWADLLAPTGQRISALWLALRGAAEVDAEARELFERWERERVELMRVGPVAAMRAKDALKEGLTDDEAAVIYSALVDPAMYDRFVVKAGWTPQRYADWLYGAFTTLVLKPVR